jgi:hypothetical protein
MKGQVLAALAAVGLAVAVSSCSSSPAPASSPPPRHAPPASSPAAAAPAAPAGYQRIGGPPQGVSLDVPSSWVSVNFSQQSLQQAIKLFGLTGSAETAFSQELQPLVKAHAVYAADVKDAGTTPGHFVTNINAYCTTSGVTQSGSAGVATLGQSWASQLQQLGAQNISQVGAQMGGVAGEESSYTLSASSSVTLHATQLEVLPKSGTACYVTLTAAGSLPTSVLAEAIATIQYP